MQPSKCTKLILELKALHTIDFPVNQATEHEAPGKLCFKVNFVQCLEFVFDTVLK